MESRARGKVRGRGIGHYLEVTAGDGNEMGGIRFETDGSVTIITGTLDYGQGHASPFAQVLAERLGVPFEKIKLLQGDFDELIAGGGTGGSRSMMQSGGAIVAASDRAGIDEGPVKRRGRRGGRLCLADLCGAVFGPHGNWRGRALSSPAQWHGAARRLGWLHTRLAAG